MTPEIATHEAGHVVALHHYFGPIIHGVKADEHGGATTSFHSPLETGTNHIGAFQLAVSVMAGIVAVKALTGHPATFAPHHADGVVIEKCYQHYLKHCNLPHAYQPDGAHFLNAAKLEAHALVTHKAAEIEALARVFTAGHDLPDTYMLPELAKLRRLKAELEQAQAATTRERPTPPPTYTAPALARRGPPPMHNAGTPRYETKVWRPNYETRAFVPTFEAKVAHPGSTDRERDLRTAGIPTDSATREWAEMAGG